MMLRSWFTDPPSAAAPTPEPSRAAVDSAWRRTARSRVLMALVFAGVWAAVIQVRLVHVQVVQHEWFAARAQKQHEHQVTLTGTRGDIVDRNGALLAYSVAGVSLGADPSLMDDPALAVDQLCEALADCSASERRDLLGKFNQAERQWVPVRSARHVSPDQEERVRALNLRWIAPASQSRRYYPGRELAAHLLGFVGTEGNGLSGLELRYDDVVAGEPGLLNVRRDAENRRLLTEVLVPASTGATLELTLDRQLQYEVERALAAGISFARALAGTAIVLDVKTGGVLSMANLPTFNPNDYQKSPESYWLNPAVQNVYEPGSTFKMITASAALEDGLFTPQSMFPVHENYGTMRVPGRARLIEDDHPSPVPLSLEDVVVKSSNVGAARIGMALGAERLTLYAQRFGLGQLLGVDLPGESAGILHPSEKLRLADLATVSMGYTVSVTPLQMAAVAAAIANGGKLMQPHIVGAVIADGVRTPVEPKEIRQSISPRTAATVAGFLENVVARGTATQARLARFDAAGKTGTAKKAIAGGYSDTDRVASFAGFLPARNPRFAILVVIDTPRNGVYGGALAAPVFKQIAEAATRIFGLTPTIDPDPPYVATEPVLAAVEPARIIRAAQAGVPVSTGASLMPDLRGLSARDALDVLHQIGLDAELSGSGSVVRQTPGPGEPVEPGATTTLQLVRHPPAFRPSGGGR